MAKFGHSLSLALAAARLNINCIFTYRDTSLGRALVLIVANKENNHQFASFVINAATTASSAQLFAACVLLAMEAVCEIRAEDEAVIAEVDFEMDAAMGPFDPLASTWVEEYTKSMDAAKQKEAD
jgi:hypothetical protein